MKSQFAVAVLSFGVISSNVALAFGLTSSEPAPASSPGSSREYVRVAGQRLIAAGDREFRIRAIGAGSLSADPIEDDYERIAQLKFNAVTVMLSYQRLYNEAKPGEYLESGWQRAWMLTLLWHGNMAFTSFWKWQMWRVPSLFRAKAKRWIIGFGLNPNYRKSSASYGKPLRPITRMPQKFSAMAFCASQLSPAHGSNGSTLPVRRLLEFAMSTRTTSSLSNGFMGDSARAGRCPELI